MGLFFFLVIGQGPRPYTSDIRQSLTLFQALLPPGDRKGIFMYDSNFYHFPKGANLPVRVDLGKLGVKLTGTDRRHTHIYYYNAPLSRPRRAANRVS